MKPKSVDLAAATTSYLEIDDVSLEYASLFLEKRLTDG